MTVTVLDDNFTGSSGALTSHTPDIAGNAWQAFGGGLNSTVLALLGDGTVSISSGTLSYCQNNSPATGDDETVTVKTVYATNLGGKIAPLLRCDGSGNGYACIYVAGTGVGQLYRFAAGTPTAIGSTFTFDATTSPDVGLHVSGQGATVTVEAVVNGSVVRTYSDTAGGRITATGKPGLGVYEIQSTSTGWRATRITATNVDPPPSGSLTITKPIADQIVQRDRGASTGTVACAGSYTGTPTHIEARLVQHGTSTPLTSFDWQTVVASPSGGNWSFNFTSVPAAYAWYDLQVRFSNDASVNATSSEFALGDLIAWWGQSNAINPFSSVGSSTLTPDAMLRVVGNSIGTGSNWLTADTTKMDGPIKMGNAIIAVTGLPVGMVSCAIGGTAIATWIPGGTSYIPALATVVGVGSKLAAVLWIQGEADTDSLTTGQYLTKLGEVFDTGLRAAVSDSSLPVILVTLGFQSALTDAGTDAIRDAQAQWCAAASTKNLRVERWDLTTSDNLHLNALGHRNLGDRTARALEKTAGAVSTYRGPRIASVISVNSTTINVSLTLDYGTDITSAGVGAWRITSAGSPVTVSTETRLDATTVQLGMAASAPSPTVGYAYGSAPSATNALKDNSALTLPLEWNVGVLASSGAAVPVFMNQYRQRRA